jgi:TolB-like protein
VKILKGFIDNSPGRADLFEAYAAQGLPFIMICPCGKNTAISSKKYCKNHRGFAVLLDKTIFFGYFFQEEKMNMKISIIHALKASWGIAVLAVFLAGCATQMEFRVERPPTIPTLGIQRLAVLPFTTSDNSTLQRQVATLLTNESFANIQATNRFTLVDSGTVLRAQSSNQNVGNIADATFSGQVLSVTVNNTSKQSSYKDKEGKTITYTTYTREVQIVFNYNVTRTRDGNIIGVVNKSLNRSSSSEKYEELRSQQALIQEIVTSGMSSVRRDVAPYTVTERRSLWKEESKDKIVKQRAKDAEAMVKVGNYNGAREAFLGIYQDTQSMAAAHNICLLIEVTGNLQGALTFMQRVYNETGNPNARDEMARIERAIDTAGLLAAYRENQNQQDRVIALMVEEIFSNITAETKLAVLNNSRNERDLAEAVTIGIIHGLQSKNITIVERGRNQALTAAERDYQLTGNVSDDDIVRIGHEAGVNAFALVSVIGSGAVRRLSLRILDVEQNTIIYQSPPTDELNL